MESYIILGIAIIAYFVFKKLTEPKVAHINGTELEAMLQDKSVKREYVDVRTAQEFSSRKVKGFKNIPVQNISSRMNEINKELPVVLMCASGSRSMQAAKVLSKSGYKNIINVRGGISSYRA